MCTSFNFKKGYYGRNLDLEYELSNSKVIITPMNYELRYRSNNNLINIKYPLIGMGENYNGFPLYYEAMNNQGLFMAGLNFNGFAYFNDHIENKENVATFEFILHILGQCSNLNEAKQLLKKINITNDSFNEQYKAATLHWIICYEDNSIVIESTKEGIKLYENQIGVLTNNPTYDFHLTNINNYINIDSFNYSTSFSEKLNLTNLSQGIGTTFLPGGLNSVNRFIRCVYHKFSSECLDSEIDNVTQVFHILNSVGVAKGTVIVEPNHKEVTIYSCCLSKETNSYYYKTYDNNQINCVSLKNTNYKDSKSLIVYDVLSKQNINYQN